MKPSVATVAALGIGGPVAGILSWLVDVIFAVKMPDHIEASFGVVIGAFVGYFFRGGRADDTAPVSAPRAVRSPALVMLLAAGIATCAMLSGCASTQKFIDENPTVARAGVQFATAKLIRLAGGAAAQEKRRIRIMKVAAEIQEHAQGEAVTIAALKAVALSRLPNDLLLEDRVLYEALIDGAAKELQRRVGDGVLAPGQLLHVDEVITWAIEGAAMTAAPVSQLQSPLRGPSTDRLLAALHVPPQAAPRPAGMHIVR